MTRSIKGERGIRFLSLPQRGMNKEKMEKNLNDWFQHFPYHLLLEGQIFGSTWTHFYILH